jgi:hypothetical protein
LKANLIGYMWRSLVISAVWLSLTEAFDLFAKEPFEIALREILVAIGAGFLIVGARMVQNEIEFRKREQ